MERLVIKSKAGSLYYNDDEHGVKLEPHEIGAHQRRLLLEKLHAYEDTGLTPDQVRELKERNVAKVPKGIQDAFGDGRLVCPNCRNSVINYFNRSRPPQFCMICGQRLKFGE